MRSLRRPGSVTAALSQAHPDDRECRCRKIQEETNGRRRRSAHLHPRRPHALPPEGPPQPRRVRAHAARVALRHVAPDDRAARSSSTSSTSTATRRCATRRSSPRSPTRTSRPSSASSTSRSTCRRGRCRAPRSPSSRDQVRTVLNGAEQAARGIGAHADDDRDPADAAARPPGPQHAHRQPALPAAQRADLRGARRGHAARDRRRRSGCGPRPSRSRPRRPAPACSCHLQVAPESFAAYWNAAQVIAGGAAGRRARTRRTCSARSCGARRASRCSTRPPTRARTSSRSRACGRGCGSASAGSPRSSTCSRRTCATSPRCCRSATTRTR